MEPGGGGLARKAIVMDVLNAALLSADPRRAVLASLQSNTLVEDLSSVKGKIYVIGAGKAAAAMSLAAEETLDERIAKGLAVVKEGHTGAESLHRIELLEAGHPVPDQRGVEGTARLLELASEAQAGDLVLCLISGGGSALLTSPAEGITLEDIQVNTGLLLRSGATINELNCVRKHLSRVAGGLLARIAAPARVVSLILSDVTGSPLDVIASGPTAPDPTTYSDALEILDRHGIAGEAPGPVLLRLESGARGEVPETPKPGDPVFERVSNIIIADNVIAVEAAAARACEMGFETLIMSTYLEGEAREVGVMLAGIAKEIATHGRPVRQPGCVLFGGETTVTVRGSGTGGRNTELALSAAISLQGWGPDLVVASLATDGGDGTSPSAGAIADGTTIDRANSLGLDAHDALERNNSYPFWDALGEAIMTGPTGTNVNDIIAVFVF